MFTLIVRRVLWMLPTLWIISLVSFALIQLPPGDYLTSYVTALEETGETVSLEQVEALRKRYNLDEPFVLQYSRWLNDLMPFGFRRAEDGAYLSVPDDNGGRSINWPWFKWPDLGTSFEWNRPVGELIGERLLLTMTISIFTLLFTWALAIPIGIKALEQNLSIERLLPASAFTLGKDRLGEESGREKENNENMLDGPGHVSCLSLSKRRGSVQTYEKRFALSDASS